MKKENAYMTVEAALLFPAVACVILFVVYMLLFQYNRCLMEQDLNAMALWGSSVQERDGETLEAMAESRIMGMYRDKYIGWGFSELEIELKRNRFTAKGKGNLTLPAFGRQIWSGGDGWKAQAVYEYRRLSPEAFVRLCRAVEKQKRQVGE